MNRKHNKTPYKIKARCGFNYVIYLPLKGGGVTVKLHCQLPANHDKVCVMGEV
jgi:hypothetical protein